MIAITRDDRKIRLYSGVKGAQSGIQIYSASGKLIHNIKAHNIAPDNSADISGTRAKYGD
jgi:hypothetical protein